MSSAVCWEGTIPLSFKAALWSGGLAKRPGYYSQQRTLWPRKDSHLGLALGEQHGRVFCVCLDEAQELAEFCLSPQFLFRS
jgi:hypothetical protein